MLNNNGEVENKNSGFDSGGVRVSILQKEASLKGRCQGGCPFKDPAEGCIPERTVSGGRPL